MPRSRITLAVMALMWIGLVPGQVFGFDNARVELVRTGFGAGLIGTNSALELQSILQPALTWPSGAGDPGATLIDFQPGYLAPVSDRRGLITQGRMRDVLLGREILPEPVAVDFAGNRDGRIDVADLVSLAQRLVP